MEGLRSFYDGDRQNKLNVPTTYQTDQNQNELYCSMCGETAHVNAVFFDDITRIIEETLENSFLCQECVELYDEAAYRN